MSSELSKEEMDKIRAYIEDRFSTELTQDRMDYKFEKYCLLFADHKKHPIQVVDDAVTVEDYNDWIEVREKLSKINPQTNYLLQQIKELQDRITYLEKIIAERL